MRRSDDSALSSSDSRVMFKRYGSSLIPSPAPAAAQAAGRPPRRPRRSCIPVASDGPPIEQVRWMADGRMPMPLKAVLLDLVDTLVVTPASADGMEGTCAAQRPPWA
jgi:hypothetical protein